MTEPAGIERAIFADAPVDDWLDRLCLSRLHTRLSEVMFRSGRLSAVYGLGLADGREIAVKVHRTPVDTGRLALAVRCQQVLFSGGYPCPAPIDGPVSFGGHVVVIESLLDRGSAGNAHQPRVRRTMAEALAWQVSLLRSVAAAPLAVGPAWTAYQDGPWPAPHDPIFDFARTPPGYEWLDAFAARASSLLAPVGAPDRIGHADWTCGNVRFAGTELVAAYDWDSLVGQSEAVLAGFAAGAHTEGSTTGTVAPSPGEVAGFLADYVAVRPLSVAECSVAVAAAAWVLAYNARCGVGFPARDGSPLAMLDEHRDAYLAVCW